MNLIQFLMTPNEHTCKLILCFLTLMESFLYLSFSTEILNIKTTKRQKLLYVFISGPIGAISYYFLMNPFSDIVNFITFIILLYFIFKQSIKNTFIALISTYLAIFISAVIAEIILSKFNIDISKIVTIPLYRLLGSALIYLSFGILYFILRKRTKIKNLLKISFKFTILFNLILGICIICLHSYIFSKYANSLPIGLQSINIISLIIYFIISMYSLIRTNELEQTTQDLETEKLYNKTLSLLHDNIRCFKHDFNNIVQALGGYIALNDMAGLKDYYENLLKDCKITNNLNILNPETINNPSIYSLLNNKYHLASEKGINMTFDIFTDLSNIKFNIYEFTRILGILLDNAIEASQETIEKKLHIEFRSTNKKQLFIIKNSCIDNNISTTKIFEKGYSTKESNSGIGLWKVHNILSKNTDLNLYTTVKDNIFTQQLELFDKK